MRAPFPVCPPVRCVSAVLSARTSKYSQMAIHFALQTLGTAVDYTRRPSSKELVVLVALPGRSFVVSLAFLLQRDAVIIIIIIIIITDSSSSSSAICWVRVIHYPTTFLHGYIQTSFKVSETFLFLRYISHGCYIWLMSLSYFCLLSAVNLEPSQARDK